MQTIDPQIKRAAERVTLACRALSAAADDLAIAARRDGAEVDGSIDALQAERERVCELSEELAGLARSFGTLARAVG